MEKFPQRPSRPPFLGEIWEFSPAIGISSNGSEIRDQPGNACFFCCRLRYGLLYLLAQTSSSIIGADEMNWLLSQHRLMRPLLFQRLGLFGDCAYVCLLTLCTATGRLA